MTWTFSASVWQKTVLPRASYDLHALSFDHRTSADGGMFWSDGVKCDLLICDPTLSIDVAANLMLNQDQVRTSSEPSSESVCWALYSDSDKRVSVILGLEHAYFNALTPELDRNLYNDGLALNLSTYGGFSVAEDNPYSNAPTLGQFMDGRPLPLSSEVTVVLRRE